LRNIEYACDLTVFGETNGSEAGPQRLGLGDQRAQVGAPPEQVIYLAQQRPGPAVSPRARWARVSSILACTATCGKA
jgi:hypothetical protein